jgi:hypothetical protein
MATRASPNDPSPLAWGAQTLQCWPVADAFDDRDESKVDVSRLNAPQPYVSSPRMPRVNGVANLENDDDAEI